MRSPHSAGRAPGYLALVAGAVMLWLSSQSPAAELTRYISHGYQETYGARSPWQALWAGDIVLERSPALLDYDDKALKRMADYAAWAWSERTGKRIIDGGVTTSKGSSTSGRVTFVFSTQEERTALTGNPNAGAVTSTWVYTDTGFIAGVIVYIPHLLIGDCEQHMILHEVGHAIGIFGHEGATPFDVMHHTQLNCRHALSPQDVRMAPYDESLCFVEYLPDQSLYFPSVGGFAAFLRYRDGLWSVESATPTTLRCPSTQYNDPVVKALDVRGQGGAGSGTIEHVGAGVWRLVNSH